MRVFIQSTNGVPVMAAVGDRIREGYALLAESGIECTLEWNEGNHFRDPDQRVAKAFAWVMENHIRGDR